MEVVPVNDFVLGTYVGDGRPLRFYDPTVFRPRLVKQSASDTDIKIGGDCRIEDLAKGLPRAEKGREELSAFRIFILPQRRIFSTYITIA